MSVALLACGVFAIGCDEREWGRNRHHGDYSSTDVSFGFDWLPWFGGYDVVDEYDYVTEYYSTEVVDYGGYDYGYDYDYDYDYGYDYGDGYWRTKRAERR